MTDDRKPRIIWTSGFYLETTDANIRRKIALAVEEFGAKTDVTGDRCFFIELEPTLQLMKEMGEAFQEWLDDTEEDFSEQPGWKQCKEVLEKYRKFLDGLT